MQDYLVLQNAAEIIDQGGVVAYPTESTFGIGCDPNNLSALKRILSIKQRNVEKGLIILVSDIKQAEPYILPLNQQQIETINQPNERATTWLIPRKKLLPQELCGIHPKLAVRVTNHPVAKALCEKLGYPLVSTSCNLSGQSAMSDACAIKVKMGDKLDMVISGKVGGQEASQIIDLESGQILRK